ncbi:MAG TPA: cyclase family protein [Candidatus Angelobacter sp.]|nr:cyclase family protein [Candidatus Angelobacter sp.]
MTRFIDLSHPVATGVVGYPGLPAPRIEPHISHEASRPTYAGAAEFEITRVFMVGNSGTYLDSPYHRFPDGPDVAGLPLSSLAGLRGRVLEAGPGSGSRRIELEVPPDVGGAAVLLRTRWDRHRATEAYWRPAPFVPRELAERLVALEVALVGIDAWNIDDVEDPVRPAHTTLLHAGIPIVEHLTGLDRLPPAGFRFTAVPAPIVGAASLPVRAYAEIEDAAGGI